MNIVSIILSAVVASGLTLAVVALYLHKVVEPRLRDSLEAMAEQLGVTIEERVRRGVLAAFHDAASGEPLVAATKKMTRTGASMLGEGLNILLGGDRSRPK